MAIARHNPSTLAHPATMTPPGLSAPEEGLIAQAVTAVGTRTVYVSGQIALTPDGFLGGDHETQAKQAFANVRQALTAVGATGADVARMTIYVVDHRPDLVGPIFAAGLEVFGADWPVCSGVLVGVASLALPDWLVEIDAVAVLP